MKHLLGDTWQNKNGEKYIKTEQGRKLYYRYLVEQYIGHPIPEGYTVHHIDFNHTNNTLDNFLLIPTALHVWIHRTKFTKNLFVSNLSKFK